jgi:hypothetical protein
MANCPGQSPERLLRNYFHAKDENRPHLLASVFSESATLEMVVKTGTISFPSLSQGMSAISDVLVGRFAQTYENVYSFYFSRPPPGVPAFSCDWLVGMSEKATGLPRVGCGRYDWSFRREAPFTVDRLVITIEHMQSLAPHELRSIMGWLTALPYPWCSATSAIGSAPAIGALEPVLQYLGRNSAGT